MQARLAGWACALSFCSVLGVYASFAAVGMTRPHVETQPIEAAAGSFTPPLVIALVLIASLAAHVISGWISRRKPIDPELETDLTDDEGSAAWRMVAELARAFAVRAPLLVIEKDAPGGASVIQFHRFRKICVSPDLLEAATPDEMEAVLAHEMSHIARNDSLVASVLRAGVLLSILTAGASVVAVVADLVIRLISGTTSELSLQPAGMMSLCVLLAMFTVLCDFAAMRCQEHIADMDAAAVTGRPRALISFLTRGEDATGELFTPFCTHPRSVFRCIALIEVVQEQRLTMVMPGGAEGFRG